MTADTQVTALHNMTAAQLKETQKAVFIGYSNLPTLAEHNVNPGHGVN